MTVSEEEGGNIDLRYGGQKESPRAQGKKKKDYRKKKKREELLGEGASHSVLKAIRGEKKTKKTSS